MKKIIAMITSIALLAPMVLGSGVSEVSAADISLPAPVGMRVELLEEAYGIDTLDPAFSWEIKANEGEQDIYQKAYRILIADGKGDQVVDSGWIESEESSYAKVGANITGKLSWNSLYSWKVQVKDNQNRESGFSEEQIFSTALGEGKITDWESGQGIWHDTNSTNPFLANGWLDYTVEADLTINETALGIVFRGQDTNNYLMWQFRTDTNTINPHYKVNGSIAGFSDAISLNGKATLVQGQKFRMKIQVEGQTVTAFVDSSTADGNNYVEAGQVDVSAYNLTYGAIGVRTGGSESGLIENIQVTKLLNNEILFDSNTAADYSFSGCTVNDGVVSVPRGQSTGSLLANFYTPENGNFIFLRTAFNLADTDEIEKAIVNVTAKSPEKQRAYVYNLYLNDEFIGIGPSRFGSDSSNGILYYNTYDVTEYLKNGPNAIGAINYEVAGEKHFLLQMTVFYKDGTSEILLNSGRDYQSWRSLDGTRIFGEDNNIGTQYFTAHADNINAVLFPEGWCSPGFDDSSWAVPTVKGAIVGNYSLKPYTSENVQRWLTDKNDVSISVNSAGNYVVDLGAEIVGGVHLNVNVDGEDAHKIVMRLGEEMNGDRVKHAMITGNTYQQTWTLRPGEQTVENIGMMTFRYIEILNWPDEAAGVLTADHICGVAMYQPFDESKSDFNSSDELLNQIYDTMKYTIKVTNQDLMVDSQSRERGAYEGDNLVNMMSSYAFENNYTMSRFSIEWLNYSRTWPFEYGLYAVVTSWYDYLYTGNPDSLAENYAQLESRTKDEMIVDMGDGTKLLRTNASISNSNTDAVLIDWPEGERDGFKATSAYYNSVANAAIYETFLCMANIADVLGYSNDADYYTELAKDLKAGYIKYFYDAEKGAVRDGLTDAKVAIDNYAQHGTAYALCFGLFEGEEMKQALVDYIRESSEIKMSVYGSYFLLHGLYNAEGGDVAYDLMTSSGIRSWDHMINELGATITAEAWDPTLKSNMTYSHPWGSSPGSQIVQGMFGISPLEAGFSEFQVKFQPGSLEFAEVKTPTLKGSIEASFTTNGDYPFSSAVSVPANTTAKVMIPDMGYVGVDELIVNGTTVTAAREDNYLVVELGSGTYDIALNITGRLTVSSDPAKVYVGQSNKLAVTYSDDSYQVDNVQFESSNEAVVSVDSQGNMVYNSAGKAVIAVIAVLKKNNNTYTIIYEEFVEIQEPEFDRIFIQLSGNLTLSNRIQAEVIGVLPTGDELPVEGNITFVSGDTSVFTVDADGWLTGVEEGKEAQLETILEKIPLLSDKFDIETISYEIKYKNDFTIGHELNIYNNSGSASVSGGNFSAGAAVRGYYTGGINWTDYTLHATFKIQNGAANITFRQSDASTFYLWQFRNDSETGYLKTHVFENGRGSENYELLDTVYFPENVLQPNDWNEIIIRINGNEFSTYLNGVLVNVTWDDSLTAGSIGIRNGSSESFLLNQWSVSDHTLSLTENITVNKDEENPIRNDLDTARLRKEIKQAQEIDLTNYLEDGKQAFTDALQNATDLLARLELGNTGINQEDINTTFQNLRTARLNLRIIPNKDNLTNLLKELNLLRQEDYTPASFAVLQHAIEFGIEVNNNPAATDTLVREAIERLQAAQNQLEFADNEETDTETESQSDTNDTESNSEEQTDSTESDSKKETNSTETDDAEDTDESDEQDTSENNNPSSPSQESEDNSPVKSDNAGKSKGKAVKTGDNSALEKIIILFFASMLMTSMILVIRNKRDRSR